jgi:hypothetical protein
MAIDINIPSQVKNYANLAAFPATGSLKTIFIAEDTNKTYRWTGSAYVEISASQATAWGTITGTLSSQTDLNTALSGKVPTTRTLTINGTTQDLSADRTFTISTGITIGTTAITSGTVGRVLFEGTGNVVQESANLFWDNTNGRLGIGGTPGAFNLDVVGTARVSSNINTSGQYTNVNTNNFTTAPIALRTIGADISGISIYKASFGHTNSIQFLSNDVNNRFSIGQGYIGLSSSIDFNIGRFASAAWTNAFTIFNATGNVGINTTTDAGFKLDVNGTARVSSTLGVGGALVSGGSGFGNTMLSITSTYPCFILNSTGGTASKVGFNLDASKLYFSEETNNAADWGHRIMANTKVGGLAILNNSAAGSTATLNASAVLQADSTTRGFLPPRMTTTQKNAIASPTAGLMVYDTTLNLMALYNGTIWTTL